MEGCYSIRAAAEETGLSAHTIRAWERRYGVIEPVRTGTNRRVYSGDDVRKLKLLRRAIESGHSIGMIAMLTAEELGRLSHSAGRPAEPARHEASRTFLETATQAIQALDSSTFEANLQRASCVLGIDAFLEELVVPVLRGVGAGWIDGKGTIAQEHLASALIRAHLERTRLSIQPPRDAPRLAASTPVGQNHEIGAMMAAIAAARMGWHVTYLGPNLPAKEIADAASRTRASAIALGIAYPHSDPILEADLRSLGSLLAKGCRVLAGGDAVPSYAQVLKEIDAHICHDMASLREHLSRLHL